MESLNHETQNYYEYSDAPGGGNSPYTNENYTDNDKDQIWSLFD